MSHPGGISFPGKVGGISYVTRYNRLVSKLLAGKTGEVLEGASPEMQLALVLENDRPEWLFPAETYLFGSPVTLAAQGAGNFSQIQFLNAAGSGLLVVVLACEVVNGAGLQVRTQGGIQNSAPQQGIPLDSRLGGTVAPSAKLSSSVITAGNGGAGPTGNFVWQSTPPNNSYLIPVFPLILAPGGAVSIWTAVANAALNLNFRWSERPIETSELK